MEPKEAPFKTQPNVEIMAETLSFSPQNQFWLRGDDAAEYANTSKDFLFKAAKEGRLKHIVQNGYLFNTVWIDEFLFSLAVDSITGGPEKVQEEQPPVETDEELISTKKKKKEKKKGKKKK